MSFLAVREHSRGMFEKLWYEDAPLSYCTTSTRGVRSIGMSISVLEDADFLSDTKLYSGVIPVYLVVLEDVNEFGL